MDLNMKFQADYTLTIEADSEEEANEIANNATAIDGPICTGVRKLG